MSDVQCKKCMHLQVDDAGEVLTCLEKNKELTWLDVCNVRRCLKYADKLQAAPAQRAVHNIPEAREGVMAAIAEKRGKKTEENLTQVLKLWRKGKTAQQIGQKVGISWLTVLNWLKAEGIKVGSCSENASIHGTVIKSITLPEETADDTLRASEPIAVSSQDEPEPIYSESGMRAEDMEQQQICSEIAAETACEVAAEFMKEQAPPAVSPAPMHSTEITVNLTFIADLPTAIRRMTLGELTDRYDDTQAAAISMLAKSFKAGKVA